MNNLLPIIPGTLIHESWSFHGFSGGGPEGISEFVSPPVFRIVKHRLGTVYSRLRVNCMGWPVSGYVARKITSAEADALTANATFDAFNKVYRANRVIEQVDL